MQMSDTIWGKAVADALNSTHCKAWVSLCKLNTNISDLDVVQYYHTLKMMKTDRRMYNNVMFNIHKVDTSSDTIDAWSEEFYKIVTNELAAMLERQGTTWDELEMYHYKLGRNLLGLAMLTSEGIIRKDQARGALKDLFEPIWIGVDIEDYMSNSQYFADGNTGALTAAIKEAVATNPKAVEDIRAGKDKAIGTIFGYVMKKVKADPTELRAAILAEINKE